METRSLYVRLHARTASFRVPYILDPQPTLVVPPPSTVYGLIRNAAGRWIDRDEIGEVRYRLEYGTRFWDLEKIHKIEANGKRTGTEVVRREQLYDVTLHLYLDAQWEYVFRHPRGILTIGRSGDLANVESVELVQLDSESGIAAGILVPAPCSLYGAVYALPVDFTREEPRHPVEVRSFVTVDCKDPQRAYGIRHGDYVLEVR